jgi:hypothetical protein
MPPPPPPRPSIPDSRLRVRAGPALSPGQARRPQPAGVATCLRPGGSYCNRARGLRRQTIRTSPSIYRLGSSSLRSPLNARNPVLQANLPRMPLIPLVAIAVALVCPPLCLADSSAVHSPQNTFTTKAPVGASRDNSTADKSSKILSPTKGTTGQKTLTSCVNLDAKRQRIRHRRQNS